MSTKTAEAPNLVGQQLFGTYTVTEKLGEGAMGDVYLAKQGQTGQRIAIKLLNEEAQQHEETVQRFLREARVISMMTHPNVVNVFIFGETTNGVAYMAMEYVDGMPLERIIRGTPIDEERVVDIAQQILSAIGEAHDLGIMHRDLKPENVLLTEYRGRRDYVKILDFGIAKVQHANQQLTQMGIVYGTPAYMSPEQAQAIEVDQRADLYSLGCMMYEMVTGKIPFDAKTTLKILEMQAFRPPTPPSEHGPVSPALEAIILKAMEKEPDDRYQTAAEMLEALDELGGEPDVPSPSMPAPSTVSADIPVTFQSLNQIATSEPWFWPVVGGLIAFLAMTTFVLLLFLLF